MHNRIFLLLSLLILSVIPITFNSCVSSAKLVVSQGANLSKYKYVCFGINQTGDSDLGDIIMLVENEIANTNLKPISLTNAPDDYLGYTLTPEIHIRSEKWDGGHTYITITFSDILMNQNVAVIKSDGFGMTVSQDQKLALKAIRKKLQSVFGVNGQ